MLSGSTIRLESELNYFKQQEARGTSIENARNRTHYKMARAFLIFSRCHRVMVGDQMCPDMTVIEDNSDQYHLVQYIKVISRNVGGLRVECPFYFMCVTAEGEFKLN